MASEEGWSTISHKEKPKRSAGVRTEAQESSCVRNDLVGRNVYQYQSADGGGGNMDISDLIGEPVVLRESSLHCEHTQTYIFITNVPLFNIPYSRLVP